MTKFKQGTPLKLLFTMPNGKILRATENLASDLDEKGEVVEIYHCEGFFSHYTREGELVAVYNCGSGGFNSGPWELSKAISYTCWRVVIFSWDWDKASWDATRTGCYSTEGPLRFLSEEQFEALSTLPIENFCTLEQT